jgi:hypothetical protein
MLMRNQLISSGVDTASAVPAMVASLVHARVIAFKLPFATVAWPARGQRERE